MPKSDSQMFSRSLLADYSDLYVTDMTLIRDVIVYIYRNFNNQWTLTEQRMKTAERRFVELDRAPS